MLDILEEMNGIDRKSAAKIARFISSKVYINLIPWFIFYNNNDSYGLEFYFDLYVTVVHLIKF